MTQSDGRLVNALPIESTGIDRGKTISNNGSGQLLSRQRVVDDETESTEDRTVQQLRMVGCRNEDARRVVLLKELKERVQNPPNLPNVVCTGAITSECIHLIEEVHAACVFGSVEDETQFG